jgi:hypothetical protein
LEPRLGGPGTAPDRHLGAGIGCGRVRREWLAGVEKARPVGSATTRSASQGHDETAGG